MIRLKKNVIKRIDNKKYLFYGLAKNFNVDFENQNNKILELNQAYTIKQIQKQCENIKVNNDNIVLLLTPYIDRYKKIKILYKAILLNEHFDYENVLTYGNYFLCRSSKKYKNEILKNTKKIKTSYILILNKKTTIKKYNDNVFQNDVFECLRRVKLIDNKYFKDLQGNKTQLKYSYSYNEQITFDKSGYYSSKAPLLRRLRQYKENKAISFVSDDLINQVKQIKEKKYNKYCDLLDDKKNINNVKYIYSFFEDARRLLTKIKDIEYFINQLEKQKNGLKIGTCKDAYTIDEIQNKIKDFEIGA